MPIIQNGQGLEIAVPPGQSIAVASLTGTYSATLLDGAGRGVLASASAGGATYGPYPAGATLRVKAGVDSCVAYDVGASPIASGQYPARFANNAQGDISGLSDNDGGLIPLIDIARATTALASAILAYKDGLRTRPPVMFGLGDSNFAGNGAGLGTGTVPKWAGAASRGPFDQIKSQAPYVNGLRVIDTAFFGEGNCTSDGEPVAEYDPRLTLTGGWAASGTAETIGGRWLETANTTGELKVTFGQRVDNIEIYYVVAGGASTSIQVLSSDGTVVGTFSCSGTAGIARVDMSSAKFNDGIVRIKNNAAGSAYLAGIIGYPTNEQVAILAKGCWAGGQVSDYASTSSPWRGVAYHKLIKPDYTLVQLTINDITNGTNAATYGTTLATILDTLTLNGDVVFSTGAIGSAANFYNATGAAIIQQAKLKCAAYGVPFINLHARFDNWTASNAKGYEFDDNHRTYLGYTQQAAMFSANVLAAAF